MQKKKGKVGIFGRFIAIFMTAVLFVTVMPIEAQAASVKFRIYIQDEIDTRVVDIYNDYFYLVDSTNGDTYYFEREENYIIGIKSIPANNVYKIYSTNGIYHGDVNVTTYNMLRYSRVATLNFYDGTMLLDTVYLLDFTNLNEEHSYKPKKDGYAFSGWIDKNGKPVSFPIEVGYYEVVQHGGTSNLFATWELHEHQWNLDEWNYDNDAHWHECMAEGCPIKNASEKDGYAAHDFSGRIETEREAKCYEMGLEYVFCIEDGCGAYVEREIDKIPHDYEDEWKYDNTIHYHKCKNCTDIKDEENHQMSQWNVVTEPKFSENGLKERKCQTCEYREEEIIPKLSEEHIHDFNGRKELIREPKCYEKGLEYIYCTLDVCGAYEENEIDAIPHDYEDVWRYSDVIHYHKCKKCDHSEDVENHQMSDWNVVTEATFLKDGLEERHCMECEYSEERNIAKLADKHIHDYTGREEIVSVATCTKEGVTRIHCTEEQCDSYIEKSIPMVEHDYQIGWLHNEDIHYHKCKNCDAYKDDEAHDMLETNMVKLATKIAPGIMELECVKCRYVSYKEIPYEETSLENENNEENELPPFEAPETGEIQLVHIYATLAMISGMTYLLYIFRPINVGISKEKKEELVDKLIKWAKSGNRMVKGIALLGITVILLYYHFIANFIKREDMSSQSVDTL